MRCCRREAFSDDFECDGDDKLIDGDRPEPAWFEWGMAAGRTGRCNTPLDRSGSRVPLIPSPSIIGIHGIHGGFDMS